MTFRQLQIGQAFDFVAPSYYASFFDRCVKISARRYRSLSTGLVYNVGSINCSVYNAA